MDALWQLVGSGASTHLCTAFALNNLPVLFKGAMSQLNGLKNLANFVVCNLCQSSPPLTILVPLWLIIISLLFSYLSKALFSGFLQFKGNFVDGRNNSKYRDVAPLIAFL